MASTEPPQEQLNSEVAQPSPTLCDPMDCSPSGSSVHGILQARILEWVAMPSCRGLPNPGIKPASLLLHLQASTAKNKYIFLSYF